MRISERGPDRFVIALAPGRARNCAACRLIITFEHPGKRRANVKTTLFRACAAVLGCAATIAALPACAQNWPDRPVRIVIGYSPGGTVDSWTRLLTRRLEER